MIEMFRRCIHCNSKYIYQASGDGCHREENNKYYCPECKTAINKVLKKIPLKFEKVWEKCNDFSLSEIKIIVEKDNKESIVCLHLTSFDPKDSSNKNVVGRFKRNLKFYNYSYWTKKDSFNLYVAKELNIKDKNQFKYWKEY